MRSTHARVRTSAALHASLLSASAAPSQSCASMTQCSSSASRDPVARQGRCLLDHGATYLPAAGVKASSMMGTAASTKQTGGVALLGGVYTSVEWQPACWGREVLLVTLSSRSTQTTCHVKGGNTCITTCLSRTKHQWLIDEHSLQRYPGRNRHPPRRLRSGHVPSLFPFLCNRLQERSSYSELATASRNVL